MNSQLIKNKVGFTLIEVLVSMAIFTLLVFAVAAIYISFNNTQVRTTVSQQLLNNSQYALDLMARDIRNNTIVDYSIDADKCNTLIHTAANELVFNHCIILKRADGQVFAFTSYTTDIINPTAPTQLLYVLLTCTENYSSCLELDLTDFSSYSVILSEDLNNINLDSLSFFITPLTDPFVKGGPNLQPRITIQMSTSYLSNKIIEKLGYNFQTTVSSRVYR